MDGSSAGQANLNTIPTRGSGQAENDQSGARIILAPENVVSAVNAPGDLGEVIVDNQTFKAGGSAAVVNGRSVSVGPDGQLTVDGSSAGFLALPTGTIARAPAALTLGIQVLTAHSVEGPSGAFVIGGKTLQEGGDVATLNGHVLSLGVHGRVRIDGSIAAVVGQEAEPTTIPLTARHSLRKR